MSDAQNTVSLLLEELITMVNCGHHSVIEMWPYSSYEWYLVHHFDILHTGTFDLVSIENVTTMLVQLVECLLRM